MSGRLNGILLLASTLFGPIKLEWPYTKRWTSCARGDTICPAPLLPRGRGRPSASRAAEQTQRSSTFIRRIRSTLTAAAALRVNAALSKVAWWSSPLTFWPWKWCPSHVWRGLFLCQIWSSCRHLCSRLRPNARDRQTDVRQKHRL